MDETLKKLLRITAEKNASDLHLVPARFSSVRINGDLVPLTDEKIFTSKEIESMIFSLLDEKQKEKLLKYKDLDLAFTLDDKLRLRANVYLQKNGWAASFRVISTIIKSIEELNLPPILHEFVKRKQGLILITGPAGSGKSTTLAALIDEINHTQSRHIITIEEPVEYIFSPDQSIITQREIPNEAYSWHRALKSTLRQDPDVIMIGELRDPISVSIALTAAETGHLVLGTLHTNSASQTIDRIIDALPEGQKNQARFQMASSLVGVISQRLIPRNTGGRIPACEILLANSAVKNLIRENKIYQIDLVIETSLEQGMISIERSLATLVSMGEISEETAYSFSINQERLKNLL